MPRHSAAGSSEWVRARARGGGAHVAARVRGAWEHRLGAHVRALSIVAALRLALFYTPPSEAAASGQGRARVVMAQRGGQPDARWDPSRGIEAVRPAQGPRCLAGLLQTHAWSPRVRVVAPVWARSSQRPTRRGWHAGRGGVAPRPRAQCNPRARRVGSRRASRARASASPSTARPAHRRLWRHHRL